MILKNTMLCMALLTFAAYAVVLVCVSQWYLYVIFIL